MTGEEFYRKRMDETNWPRNDLCDPPTDPRMAIHILIDHLLGEDWCVAMPEHDDQIITVAVAEILNKYPKNRFSFVKKIWKLFILDGDKTMKVMKKMEVLTGRRHGGFKVGDQIHVGKHYTATCQKLGKNGAIFMFDQYLDEAHVMNRQKTNDGSYETSDLRKFLKGFAMNSMFDEIREMMVPFKKTGDLLRIPTAEEMFGPEEVHGYCEILSHKKQWPLMKDRHNRLAYRGEDQHNDWGWLQNKCGDLDSYFAVTNTYGDINKYNAYNTNGVRVVFRLLV